MFRTLLAFHTLPEFSPAHLAEQLRSDEQNEQVIQLAYDWNERWN
jgi:hypothetical protein